MRYGVTMFVTDQSMTPVALARAVEERGFDSLYLPEHTHIPTSRRTPPPTGDAELAEEYKRTLDPFVALSMAAAVTERLELGTGILLPAQREPIVTAKAAASLDHLSGGRVVLGIGFGWNRDEIEQHGVDFTRRREHCRDHVLAMQALWRDDIAEYHGDVINIAPSWSWPKPVDRRIPVLIGGAAGPKMFAHIAEYADGWIPIGGAGVRSALDDLRRACDTAGRDFAAMRIVPFGVLPDRGKIDYYASIGITEVVFRVPLGGDDIALRVLDECAAMVGPGA